MNPGMLAVARELAATEGLVITYEQGDAGRLPYPDDTFDVVICQQGLQFFPDRVGAMREVRRVLKPGGRLVVAVMQDRLQNPEFDHFFHALETASGTLLTNMPFSWGDPAGLDQTLREAGFDTVELDVVSRNAEFEGGDQWIDRLISAVSAGVPELGALTLDQGSEIARQVGTAMTLIEARLRRGDLMIMPARSNVATAW